MSYEELGTAWLGEIGSNNHKYHHPKLRETWKVMWLHTWMFQQIYLVVESVRGGIGLVLGLGVDGSCRDGIGQMFICLHHVYWCRNKDESVDTRWQFGVSVSLIPYVFAASRVEAVRERLFGVGLPSASSRICLQLERCVYRSQVDSPKTETCGSIDRQIG